MTGAVGSFFFLVIPLIFLSNINLMLFPTSGPRCVVLLIAPLRQRVPRYFHFLARRWRSPGCFWPGGSAEEYRLSSCFPSSPTGTAAAVLPDRVLGHGRAAGVRAAVAVDAAGARGELDAAGVVGSRSSSRCSS